MTPCRRDPPLPVTAWNVATARLPLGQPAVTLTIGGTAVTLTRDDAGRLGRDLVHIATPVDGAAR